MSDRFSSEQLASVHHAARSIARGSGRHELEMEALVSASDIAVQGAETALADALALSDVGVDRHRQVLEAGLRQAIESAKEARRLCFGARQQRLAAGLLLEHLDRRPKAASGAEEDIDSASSVGAVLVVDDYTDNRELAATVLRLAGFVVHTAANGLEGLFAAYDVRPAVIVMDVTMPVLGGVEATRLIKASAATKDSRVIAYTGNPPAPDAATQTLFAAVLQKPVSPATLVATVRQVARL
jgi:two-component system cell cycle response regulator DivK